MLSDMVTVEEPSDLACEVVALPTATDGRCSLPPIHNRPRQCSTRALAPPELNCVSNTVAVDTVECPSLSGDDDRSDREQVSVSVPGWLKTSTQNCGMLPEAWIGWGAIFKQPHIVFLCSVLANLFTLLTNSSVLLIESGPLRLQHHLPAAIYVLLHSTSSLLILRQGPAVAKTKPYNAALVPAILTQFLLTVRLMLGPEEHVPFGNRLLFVTINSLAIWNWAFTSTTGTWGPDHPPKPYESLMTPIADSTVRVLRLTDAITDMLIIRMMLQMGEEPCFWFGEQGGCVRWRVLAAIAGVFAVIDLASGLFLAMSGSGVGRSNISTRMKRIFTIAHVVSFSCELAILCVTLIKLFSEFRVPATDMSPSQKRNAITVTLASFTITIITFSITMFGAQKMVFAATRVASFMQKRITQPASRPGSRSAPGAIAPTGTTS